ncbi:MAG: Eco57I restriction-modification methylase domain-containing protein [Candidatus Poribacteria bacterium]
MMTQIQLEHTPEFPALIRTLLDISKSSDKFDFSFIQWSSATGRDFNNLIPKAWLIKDPEVERDKLAFCVETAFSLVAKLIFAKQMKNYGLISFEEDNLSDIFNQSKAIVQLQDNVFCWYDETVSALQKCALRLIDLICSLRSPTPLAYGEPDSFEQSKESFDNLYLNLFGKRIRKALGEFYTPAEIVNYILNAVDYTAENQNLFGQNLLDPACGSGCFIVEALGRFIKSAGKLAQREGYQIILAQLSENRAIVGFDINPLAVLMAKIRFALEILPLLARIRADENKDYTLESIPIFRTDALRDESSCQGIQLQLLEETAPYFSQTIHKLRDESQYDYVVGNPPYLRIQRVSPELREYYRKTYTAADGRFDLYILFIERGLKWLKPSGKLGFVTSNKFITSNYGKKIRQYILQHSIIEQIIDLADTKIFDVAVLPCIIILRKGKNRRKSFTYSIARSINNYAADLGWCDKQSSASDKSLMELIEKMKSEGRNDACFQFEQNSQISVKLFPARMPTHADKFWHFVPLDEQKLIYKIKQVSTHTLDQLAAKIIVGLKTNADDVFANPMTEEFIRENRFEQDLIYPLLRGPNVQRWSIIWTGREASKDTYILYPHIEQNGKVIPIQLGKYPQAASYLLSNRDVLERRTYLLECGRKWYEIWVHQSPSDFARKYKLVTPDITTQNNFALDTNGYFCLGSCFVILLKDETAENYKYMLGILNSKALEYFHKRNSSTSIYAGRYRYWTSYMKDYPIISLSSEKAKSGNIGSQIINQVDDILRAISHNRQGDVEDLEARLNELVYELYGLTGSEVDKINEFTFREPVSCT